MSEDIVISGISGRFPESDNLDELWTNLVTNRDMITEDDRRFPKGMYGTPHRSGKLKNLDKFDAQYFGIPDMHANISDPLLRIIYEVVFETLIDSGNDPAKLSGNRIGVFVANEWLEKYNIVMKSETNIKNNSQYGTYTPFLANNISHYFNFKGPSYTSSNGCCAAATALNQAIVNINSGQCDSAIVAGCHSCLNPLVTFSYTRGGVLSQDGKSKFMDKKADGYPRSEICCAVYLEKAKSAKRVYSRVLASNISHDGYKSKRYAPSSDSISDLITETITKANIDKNNIHYVECHGSGTRLGDLAEVTAVYNALCADSERTDPVWLGSVKTNLGHAEVGSFMSSLAKVLLVLDHGTIPANLHLNNLNPDFEKMIPKIRHIGENIEYDHGPVLMPSIGFGGSIAVILLEPNEKIIRNIQFIEYPAIIPLFSRTEDGIQNIINKINDYTFFGKLTLDFIRLIYSIANLQNMPYRGYMISHDIDSCGTLIFRTHYSIRQSKKPLIFRFGNMNYKMSETMARFESFKVSYDNLYKYYQDRNIKLESLEENSRRFIDNVLYVMSMVNMLLSLNVLPDQCIADSLFGQLLCAYVNRDLSEEHLLQTAYQISKLNITADKINEQILTDCIKINSTGYFYGKFIEGEYAKTNLANSRIENSIVIDFSSIDSKTDINHNINSDNIRLYIFSESDFQTNVLTLLGRLYEWGLDIEWNALYASSGQYPVSRGTQSVVPLLQWDHSKDYFVPKYTDFI